MLHVSNGGGRLLQLTDFFITLFFVGDGVITVMIDRPRQADDDADKAAAARPDELMKCRNRERWRYVQRRSVQRALKAVSPSG
ncbi:hypothetical protein EAE13_13265 [Escherichia coli]|nr:hypothetical protein EAE13_13265 [Escherichia coli]